MKHEKIYFNRTCAQTNASGTSRVRRPGHTNFPFRVCSLSTECCSNVYIRSVETKSREGKALFEWTRSQSEWQGKDSGRRQTNVHKHRKGKPPVSIIDRGGYFRFRRSCVRWEKSVNIEEESGSMHSIWRRCKRRWHESTVFDSNWGDPVSFQNIIGPKILNSLSRLIKLVERISYPHASTEESGYVRISSVIRRKVERLNDVTQEVGDGHSSADGEDNITSLERRAISLTVPCVEEKRLW